MRDYYRHCTVGQLKQQIQDTIHAAKQKMVHISASRRRDSPSLINQKFYSYVNEIKEKQQQYESFMNKTNQIQMLLNRRRNKINESLEKYQKNKRSKTLENFHYPHSRQEQSSQNKKKEKCGTVPSMAKTAHARCLDQSHMERLKQMIKERYQTEPSVDQYQQKTHSMQASRKSKRVDHPSITGCQRSLNQNKNLRSITKVINYCINTEKKNEKQYTFAKNTIKTQEKRKSTENNENKIIQVKRNLKMQTSPNEPIVVQAGRDVLKRPKKKRNQSTLEHKGIMKIKERIQDNQTNNQIQWKTSKKLESIKTILLKHQYETFLKRDLKNKILKSKVKHKKII